MHTERVCTQTYRKSDVDTCKSTSFLDSLTCMLICGFFVFTFCMCVYRICRCESIRMQFPSDVRCEELFGRSGRAHSGQYVGPASARFGIRTNQLINSDFVRRDAVCKPHSVCLCPACPIKRHGTVTYPWLL